MNELINQILENSNNPKLKMNLYHSLCTDGKIVAPAELSIKLKLDDDTYNRIKSELNHHQSYEPAMKRGNNNA